MKIIGIIVTHNRKLLLERCLYNVQKQYRKLDKILVINNGSTDGTVELLEILGISFITQENLGSAGGWHRGIVYALENNYDAVWLMDDDGYPDLNALLTLQSQISKSIVCASSVVVREDHQSHFVFPFPIVNSSNLPVIFRFPRKYYLFEDLSRNSLNKTYPFAHFFNGALISIDAIKRIGNVNTDYFMSGDEVDYYFRLLRVGKIISCLDALHYHPNVNERPFTNIKIYYYLKNTLITNNLYLNFPTIRNILAIMALLYRVSIRNNLFITFSLLFGKNSKLFYRAISFGFKNKIGIDHCV